MDTKRDILRKSHGFVEKSAIRRSTSLTALSLSKGNPLVRAEPAVARQSAIGFTLVELLVVVVIIALLVGMLLPSLNRFIAMGEKAKTQATINLIDGACQQYFTDFEDYPPSRDATDYNGWTGSELVVLFLTGYGPDLNDDGIPDLANLDTDDGVEDYGFRVKPRQTPYHGPYNNVEKLDTRIDTRPEFVDVFGESGGNPILYYRWTGSSYNSLHNIGDPSNVSSYAQNAGGKYYRTDFILISSGLNEDWDEPSAPKSDDVTNFFNR